MVYNQIFFALKEPDKKASEGYIFRHIYAGLFQTKHCGDGPYFKVRVSELKKGEKSVYWGWKDFEDNEFHFIYPGKILTKMCSPDFFEYEIRNKEGKLVNLKLEEICEVE